MKISSKEAKTLQVVLDVMVAEGSGGYPKTITSKLGFNTKKYLELAVKLKLAEKSQTEQDRTIRHYYVLLPAGRFPDAVDRILRLRKAAL